MERDDEHKKWVWKRAPEPEKQEKDQDGRATARDQVEPDGEEPPVEVSPLVSLWRSALDAMRDAMTNAHALKQEEEEQVAGLQMSWGNARIADGETN